MRQAWREINVADLKVANNNHKYIEKCIMLEGC